jgi:hypothetical protein
MRARLRALLIGRIRQNRWCGWLIIDQFAEYNILLNINGAEIAGAVNQVKGGAGHSVR